MDWYVCVCCSLNFVRNVRYFKLYKVNSLSIIKVLFVLFLALAVSAVSAFALVNVALATPTSFPVYAWGRNDHGQLGIGNNNNDISLPEEAILPAGVRGWSEFYAGPLHNMAIATDGRLFVWGLNDFGQLGIGSNANSYNIPQALPFPAGVNDWQDVQLGLSHTLALCVDGRLFAWGRNQYGQLGIGSTTNHNTPQPVPLPQGVDYWIAIAGQSSSPGHSLAIANTGQLFAWGNNQFGQLGLGNSGANTHRNTPQPVPFPANVDGWSRVYTGQGHTLAICINGNLFSWGQNNYGQLGLGGSVPGINQPTPQPVTRPAQIPNWDTLYVGTNYVRAITPEGRFIGWGQNNAGQLGTGTNNNYSTPQAGVAPAGVVGWDGWYRVFSGNNHTLAVTHPCVDFPNGRWFAWGWNMGGRLGEGPAYLHIDHRLIPTEITHNMPDPPAGTNWTAFLATHTAMVILAPRDSQVHLTKTLQLNEGTIVPGTEMPANTPASMVSDEATFTFRFVPRSAIRISDDPVRYSHAQVPAITDRPITINPDTATAPVDGVFTVTGNTVNIWTSISALSPFPGSGVFVWEVYEVPNSSGLHNPPNVRMAYDANRFQIRAHVNAAGILEALEIFEMEQDAQNNWQIVLPKLDGDINFTNTYTRLVGTEGLPGHNALLISKEVEGEMADLSVQFDFTLTLTNPALTPPAVGDGTTGPVIAQVVQSGTNPPVAVSPARTVNIALGDNAFTLAHNESLLIPQLPAGTSFTITEDAHSQFRPQATVTAIPVPPATGTYPKQNVNTDLETGTYIIHQVNNNIAAFTNTHQWDTPTGLFITSTPWVALGAAALLLGLLATSRSRKRVEELPLVF